MHSKTLSMKHQLFGLAIIALFISCTEQAKTGKPEPQSDHNYTAAIDSFLTKLDKDQSFMGSVSISKNGEVIYSNTIGYCDYEKETKANENTKYRIASITKTFTAVLVFKAIEANKLQLNQAIGSFFPDLLKGDQITIAHLLHHQSGIPSYTKDDYFWENRTQAQSADDLLDAIIALESSFEPGENTVYSNSNYFLLAQLLERVYEDSYENLLEKYITKQLKLHNTFEGKAIIPDNNECFSYTIEGGEWELFPETHLSLAKGSGSLVSTPADLNVFFRSLMNGELVSSASLEQMTTIVGNHGMGIFRYSLHDQSGHGHGGNIDGFTASSIYFEDIDVALSITSNASSVPLNEVYSEVLNLYLGQQEVAISEDEIKNYVGVYTFEEDPSDQSVFKSEGNTLILVIKGEFREPLVYKGNGRFLFNQMYGESISFTFSEDGKELIFEQAGFKGVYKKGETANHI